MRQLILALSIFATPFSAAAVDVSFPETLERDDFQGTIVQAGDVYVSGQPSEEGIAWLKTQGVTLVVSLRRPEEMEDREAVPFDEPAAVESAGMNYLNIPLGGDYGYEPGDVDRLHLALAANEGKVLIHCTVAWRASHMWAAYLMKHRGMDPDEALEHVRAINLDQPPWERLLGTGVDRRVLEDDG